MNIKEKIDLWIKHKVKRKEIGVSEVQEAKLLRTILNSELKLSVHDLAIHSIGLPTITSPLQSRSAIGQRRMNLCYHIIQVRLRSFLVS